MAISTNGGAAGPGKRRFHGNPSLSEINVTPFVDVVLVLLIIFMLTAHVMEYGIEVDVPKTKQVSESTKELPVISISKSGEVYLNKDMVNINSLPATLRQRFAGQGVYVRADKETPWDPIAQVLAGLKDAKVPVNMVTQPDEGRRR